MDGPVIAIAVFPWVEELDWIGPWEVLSSWARRWPEDGAAVFTVAEREGVIECANGARFLPDHTWDTAPDFTVLLWPGGVGAYPMLGDDGVRARVRGAAAEGTLMASVCTGALVYADAGLLDGRPATTHRDALGHLESLGTGIVVRGGDRFVDDGNMVTAAGVSAGIDMALHLVRRLHSEERARQVRRFLQYDPQPPV